MKTEKTQWKVETMFILLFHYPLLSACMRLCNVKWYNPGFWIICTHLYLTLGYDAQGVIGPYQSANYLTKIHTFGIEAADGLIREKLLKDGMKTTFT